MTTPKRGRPCQNPSKWLTEEATQVKWVWDYMEKIGIGWDRPFADINREIVLEQLDDLVKTKSGDTAFQTMKAAWRDACFKRTHHRLSLAIPLTTFNKLKRMAGKTAHNEAVEKLIERGFDFEEEERKHRRQALEKEKAQLQTTWPKNPPAIEVLKLQRENAALKKELDRKDEEIRCLVDASRLLRLEAAPPDISSSPPTIGTVPLPTPQQPDEAAEPAPLAVDTASVHQPTEPAQAPSSALNSAAENDAAPTIELPVEPQELAPVMPGRLSDEGIYARLKDLAPKAQWFWSMPVMEAMAKFFDKAPGIEPAIFIKEMLAQGFEGTRHQQGNSHTPLHVSAVVRPVSGEVASFPLEGDPLTLFQEAPWTQRQRQLAHRLIPAFPRNDSSFSFHKRSLSKKMGFADENEAIAQLIIATCNNAFKIWRLNPKVEISRFSISDYVSPIQLQKRGLKS